VKNYPLIYRIQDNWKVIAVLIFIVILFASPSGAADIVVAPLRALLYAILNPLSAVKIILLCVGILIGGGILVNLVKIFGAISPTKTKQITPQAEDEESAKPQPVSPQPRRQTPPPPSSPSNRHGGYHW